MEATLQRLLGVPVARLERRPYDYETSNPLEELEVVLEDGRELRVLRKDLRAPPAARPAFLHDPAREIVMYRDVLADADLGTAKFYGALDGQLFIEKVEGRELWQVGELDVWLAVARRLADLHGVLAPEADAAHLLQYDADFYRLWLDRAQQISGPLGIVAEVYEGVIDRLTALPQGLIHGELYPSNVLVSGDRICLVDWELAARGPQLLDLAALATGWPQEDQHGIAAAYGEAHEGDLDACRLHLAVRWLGWARDWTPPAEQARDWGAEARVVAERLAV